MHPQNVSESKVHQTQLHMQLEQSILLLRLQTISFRKYPSLHQLSQR
jgi:hypothetical protein